MAISSNPNSRSNSSSRNSEANSPMRRSFNESPFQRPSIHTNPRSFVPSSPANSPTESSRTSSSIKEEKENDKDHETLKPTRARSPSVSRNSNRFMMPTISASSKTNPSPRKKVLADKNEPLKTYISSSDLRNSREKNDQRPDEGFDSKELKITEDVYDTPTNTNPLPKCPSRNFTESSDIKKPITSISPLDDDPSLPPYDPKTNYLSPRPQFLHYKPNPRLELYYQKEQGTEKINLEDSFWSESSSDTEISEESEPKKSENEFENDSSVEVHNELSEKKLEEAFSVEGINGKLEKGSENDSSVETSSENSEKESKIDSFFEGINEKSEKELKDYSVQAIIEKFEKELKEVEPKVSAFETKKETETRFFTRRKVISLLLVLSIAFLSLSYTHSPFSDSPAFKNLSSSKFYEENFNGFARNLKLFSDYSSSYVNELIGSLRGEEKLNLLQFSNVSSMQEDPFVEVNRFEEICEHDDVEPVFEDGDEFESQVDPNLENEIDFENKIIQDLHNGTDFEENLCLEEASSDSEIESSIAVKDSEIESNTESPSSGDDHLISYSKIESSTAYSDFENIITTSLSEVRSFDKGDNFVSNSEIEPTTSVPNSGTFQVDSEYDSKILEILETTDSKIEPVTVEFDSENTLEMYDSNSSKQFDTMAICLLAIALIAAPVLIFLKRQNSNTSIPTVHIDPKSTNGTMKLPAQKNYSPEVDLAREEPCLSEMSSSYNSKRGTTNDATSQERRKHKRVSKMKSLGTSSEISMSDSPSYGSFTTYEKLPIKHGYGDDEVVTPVRRSSRIKKIQIISS